MYQVTNADGVPPEIFVLKRNAPAYKGATAIVSWEHVAYVDELTDVPTTITNPDTAGLVRRSIAIIDYTSIDKAETAIQSIRAQVQRLMNELKTLDIYTQTNTYIISSTN